MSEQGLGSAPTFWPKTLLVYIEWYSQLKPVAEPTHNMYSIRKVFGTDGKPTGSIIDLASICQSCMLFPNFEAAVDTSWTSDNVLDSCSSFFINNWHSTYSYKTIW
jgi:hypothetical protein